MKQNQITNYTIITAGSAYLDIDAYACMVAMAELLNTQNIKSIAYSDAPCNYSVCNSLIKECQITRKLQPEIAEKARYIVVDVSDPEFLKSSVPLDSVAEVYDHHVGFEDYWRERIGQGAHIEFIGSAATLIYREWERAGLQKKMSRSTALLLIAAILDNTLNLKSSNTTGEDVTVFNTLCEYARADEKFQTKYFSEVQRNVEKDLKNAIFNDIKNVQNNPVLPSRVAQLCVWNAESILARLSEIRKIFANEPENWMINIVDIKNGCNYFICDNEQYQEKIENSFNIRFVSGIAKTEKMYLRKEILKKTYIKK